MSPKIILYFLILFGTISCSKKITTQNQGSKSEEIPPKSFGFQYYFDGFSEGGISDSIPYPFTKGGSDSQIVEISQGIFYYERPCMPQYCDIDIFWDTNLDCSDFSFAMRYYLYTVNKWEYFETKYSIEYINNFLQINFSKYNKYSFYLPALCLHFIDLDKDGQDDLYIYDGTDGTHPISLVFRKEDTNFIEISNLGYIKKLKQLHKGILTMFSYGPEGASTDLVWDFQKYVYDKGNIKMIPDALFVSSTHFRRFDTLSQFVDQLFITTDTSKLYLGMDDKNFELYPSGSYGYILHQNNDKYIVAMINNKPQIKSYLDPFIKQWLGDNFRPYFSIGYMKVEDIHQIK